MGRYSAFCLGISLAFWATNAHAMCPVGQEAFTSCEIKGRNTEVFVCHDDQVATYSYGPIGGPASQRFHLVRFEPANSPDAIQTISVSHRPCFRVGAVSLRGPRKNRKSGDIGELEFD